MAQVSVTHPINDQAVDANTMRAQLEAMALGINTVDATQLANDSVTTDAIKDENVPLSKLKPGQIAQYATLLDSDGNAPPSNIEFDDGSGDTHAPLIQNNHFAPLRTSKYEFRKSDGSDLIITPPQDCYALFHGQARVYCNPLYSTHIYQVYLALWDENQSADYNDVAYHHAEVQTIEIDEEESFFGIQITGMREMTGGVNYKVVPVLKPILPGDDARKCDVTLYKAVKNTWIGVTLLPR